MLKTVYKIYEAQFLFLLLKYQKYLFSKFPW